VSFRLPSLLSTVILEMLSQAIYSVLCSCNYILMINTPRLCNIPGFSSTHLSEPPSGINCREIVPDGSMPKKEIDSDASVSQTLQSFPCIVLISLPLRFGFCSPPRPTELLCHPGRSFRQPHLEPRMPTRSLSLSLLSPSWAAVQAVWKERLPRSEPFSSACSPR
jgi:hypothetical protein